MSFTMWCHHTIDSGYARASPFHVSPSTYELSGRADRCDAATNCGSYNGTNCVCRVNAGNVAVGVGVKGIEVGVAVAGMAVAVDVAAGPSAIGVVEGAGVGSSRPAAGLGLGAGAAVGEDAESGPEFDWNESAVDVGIPVEPEPLSSDPEETEVAAGAASVDSLLVGTTVGSEPAHAANSDAHAQINASTARLRAITTTPYPT